MDLRLGAAGQGYRLGYPAFLEGFMRKIRHAPAALDGTDNGLDGVCAHGGRAAMPFAGS